MLTLKITGLVAILAASAQAQSQYWIDPETVDIKTKSALHEHNQSFGTYTNTLNSHMVL